jgi:hypothetical protein
VPASVIEAAAVADASTAVSPSLREGFIGSLPPSTTRSRRRPTAGYDSILEGR